MKSLAELRAEIKGEVPRVGSNHSSHNTITRVLNHIAKSYGKKEASKAIIDFKLERFGWRVG